VTVPLPSGTGHAPARPPSRFAIRDDDTCYFTRPAQLESLYGALWERHPVSLSVIPFATPVHRWHRFTDVDAGTQCHWLHENGELVDYLRTRIAAGHVEVMLHGFSHEFKQYRGASVPECMWKPRARLTSELQRGKAYLEQTLGCAVKVFVPPGNAIGAAGIHAVEEAGLHLSGLLGYRRDRPASASYARAFARRWAFWLRSHRPYPFPLQVGRHRELVAYALTPRTDVARFRRTLDDCAAQGAPFVLGTHYWEFERAPEMRDVLGQTLDQAMAAGCLPAFVSECVLAV